jgi:hypothetical protein
MVEFDIAQAFLIIFASIGVGFSIFEAYMRWLDFKPRVRVRIYASKVPSRDESSRITSQEEFDDMWDRLPDYVFIRAENVGSKSVTLLSSRLILPGTMTYAPDPTVPGSEWESNATFPHELVPGKSCSVYAPIETVKRYLKMGGLKGTITIRASYLGEVGNEYYSKENWSEMLKMFDKKGRQITITLDSLPKSETEVQPKKSLWDMIRGR